MKSLINRLLPLLLIFIIFISCDDFLEEDPRGVLSSDTFFNSDQEARAAVNGLYSFLYSEELYNQYGLKLFYMYGADVIEPSREGGGILNDINNYTLSESRTAGAEGFWTQLYRIVQNSNAIIENIADNSNLSDSGRDQYLGEALFLRSLAYYHLTNIFGDVPYYRDNISIEEARQLGRFDKFQIRKDLIDDLQQAKNLMPGNVENGRASKWAAATLAVKINLIQENWEEARNGAVEIINNSPHQLLNDYADVFDPMNPFNNEIIWAIEFVKDLNPSRVPDLFAPRQRDEPKNGGERAALQRALDQRNEGFVASGLAIPKCGFADEFPMDDLRRPLNVIQEYLGFELNYPYMPKMWNLDQINSPRANHGDDYIIFRLADVYLMAAEAENELNGPAGAYEYINKVRERAYEPDQPLEGLSQSEFREAIYDERKWELAGEGHRRMDLIRWGILVEVIKNTRHCAYDPASNIQPHHVHFPIPVEELQLNPNLLESDPTNNGYR